MIVNPRDKGDRRKSIAAFFFANIKKLIKIKFKLFLKKSKVADHESLRYLNLQRYDG